MYCVGPSLPVRDPRKRFSDAAKRLKEEVSMHTTSFPSFLTDIGHHRRKLWVPTKLWVLIYYFLYYGKLKYTSSFFNTHTRILELTLLIIGRTIRNSTCHHFFKMR